MFDYKEKLEGSSKVTTMANVTLWHYMYLVDIGTIRNLRGGSRCLKRCPPLDAQRSPKFMRFDLLMFFVVVFFCCSWNVAKGIAMALCSPVLIIYVLDMVGDGCRSRQDKFGYTFSMLLQGISTAFVITPKLSL